MTTRPPPSATRVGSTIGSIVIDCNDLALMTSFWRAVAGYEMVDFDDDQVTPEDEWVTLRDPVAGGVNVALQRVREPRSGKNRLHIDLFAKDPEEEAARILAIGARRAARLPQPDDDFILLEDPEGNLFCVVDDSAS